MSTDFEKVLVKADVLCVTDKIKYAVLKGGQNVTQQSFKAISQSTSAHVFNIAVPSLETIISREVLWTTNMTLRIETNAATKLASFPHMYSVNYGVTDALGPFALHQLVNTMTATINNNSVSMNVQDVLPAILRMLDPEDISLYDSTTPTTLDYLANYRDGVDLMAYQIINSPTGPDRAVIVNVGATTLPAGDDDYSCENTQKFISYPNNVLSYDMNRPSAGGKYNSPRGSFIIKRISTSPIPGQGTIPQVSTTIVYVDVQITEPLLLSPFIFGNPENKQGIYGVTNMNFQMNMTANANRAWRSVKFLSNETPPAVFTKNVTVESFSDSQLQFTFYTGHPSDVLPSRNIVPFYELPVYRTSGDATLAARSVIADATGRFGSPATAEIRSSNTQLNMVPDKLIIFCRRLNMDSSYADAYLTITKVNINFNNSAGLLSNMSQEQLYKASVLSGLKNMSWSEFSGLTMSVSDSTGGVLPAEPGSGFTGVGAYTPFGALTVNNNITTGVQLVPTVGSMVILNFAEVIQLTEDYYAPSSLGSYNLQIAVTVANNQTEAWVEKQWELVVIPMNSGCFVTERGTSSVYTALLTKKDVLDAASQVPYSHGSIKRMIGGGFLDNLKSAIGWINSKLPMVREVLGHIPNQYAKSAHDVLKAVGYGKSAGGMSAGALQNRLM